MTAWFIGLAFVILIWVPFAIDAWRETGRIVDLLADPAPQPGDDLMALADATRERLYCRCIGCSDQREAHERELRGQP